MKNTELITELIHFFKTHLNVQDIEKYIKKIEISGGDNIVIEGNNQCEITITKNYYKLDNAEIQSILNQLQSKHLIDSNFFKRHIVVTLKNLGERFSEELNFRLPITQKFHSLSKNEVFQKRFIEIFDTYLIESNQISFQKTKESLADIIPCFQTLNQEIATFVEQLNWSIEIKIEIEPLAAKLNKVLDICYEKRNALYMADDSYESEIVDLNKMTNCLYDFKQNIKTLDAQLANTPILFIQGEAGTGKSHLLGDIAKQRVEQNLPTIFLIGTNFKQGDSAWDRIIKELELPCTKTELLENLNNLGKTNNVRVLILLDALNEGAGHSLWFNELAGFIHEINQYPYLGLVGTVRNVYLEKVIRKEIREIYPIIEHKGFLGNEYAALAMFCKHYGLQAPVMPLLSPEFTNPLFLKLTCIALSESQNKVFPKGGQGIITIFENYLAKVFADLQQLREEYDHNPKLLHKALETFTSLADINYMRVELDKANQTFDKEYPKYQLLLNDLINHSILIKNISYNYETREYEDYLMFAYQRLGDFIKAKSLLQPYTTISELKNACQTNAILGEEFLHLCDEGILELLSILLPEKYSVELFEVYDYIYEDNNVREWNRQRICTAILSSLSWRRIETIDNEKITKWLQNEEIDYHSYLNIIVLLTAIPNHPFNADRLFRILAHCDMSKRDAFWQKYLWYYLGNDDSGNPYPLQRLVDWAWTPQISAKADSETVRLVAQTLTWVLASTYPKRRDSVTKALVNLLQEQHSVLIQTLQRFQNVEDMYIQERLYAVAYGCILRTTNKDGITQIATYTYNTIFSQGNPPVHVLLRCYARCIIEYAKYRGGIINIDENLIKPPYNSIMPYPMPKAEDIKKYDIAWEEKDTENDKTYKRVQNRISFSITYEEYKDRVNYILRQVSPVNESVTLEYKGFLKQLPKTKRDLLKFYYKLKELEWVFLHKKGQSPYKRKVLLQQKLIEIGQSIKVYFSESEQALIFGKYIEHLEAVYKQSQNTYHDRGIDQSPIRAWIVQRVFELGFNVDLHYDFDSHIIEYGYGRDMPDRIGKKYENIAYYEILARIFDNHKIQSDYSTSKKYAFYQGSWQHLLRDIDPTSIAKEADENEDEVVKLEVKNQLKKQWWNNHLDYQFVSGLDVEWIRNLADLPNIFDILERNDENQNAWLYLESHLTWKSPKPIGEDSYRGKRKDMFYQIRSYLVPTNQKSKMITYLETEGVYGRWLPEAGRGMANVYAYENYWSLASKETTGREDEWKYLKNKQGKKTNLKLKVTTNNATGEFSEDKAGTKRQYLMPCEAIFEGMNLQYGSEDGYYYDKEGKIIAFAIELNPFSYYNNIHGLIIRKDSLLTFLAENKLEIIWAVIGEKMIASENHRSIARNNLSGVYYLQDGSNQLAGKIIGDLEEGDSK